MSVEKGVDWGERAQPPADLAVFDDAHAAMELLTTERRANRPLPAIGLRRGDLVRTLGGSTTADLATAREALHVTVDLGAVLADGCLSWFLEQVVVRRAWLRGPVIVVATAAFLGHWNMAPRAHPGDGRLDIVETTSMRLSDRWKARRRLPAGTHLPHPDIATRRAAATQYDFAEPTPVWIDGARSKAVTSLSVRLEPDAVDLWI